MSSLSSNELLSHPHGNTFKKHVQEFKISLKMDPKKFSTSDKYMQN